LKKQLLDFGMCRNCLDSLMALISTSGPTLFDYPDQLGSLHQTWKECFCETSVCWNIEEACRIHCAGHTRQSSAYRSRLSRWFWFREKVEGGGCKGLLGEVLGCLSRRKDLGLMGGCCG
jgi:hypothetical protein